MKISETVVVRGGGDLATGIIWRLHRVGYRVVCLEAPLPTVIRRPVSAAEAVFAGQTCVEGLRFQLLPTGTFPVAEQTVPVWIDPQGESIAELAPDVVVDAGDLLGHVGETPVTAAIGGLLRGLIHPSVPLKAKMKIGDIDPRNEEGSWLTISDKAMAVAGGVLEAILADLSEEDFFCPSLELETA
ncbi:MAG: hypothetical protein JMJ93_08605 [Synergistaceae bacterium]|nr:hypothetical protein [Synergistaceae bacterium]